MPQIKRMKSEDRVAELEKFRGEYVELDIDRGFEDATYYGECVAAGMMWSGTTPDVVVIRASNGRDYAFSGASVRSIKKVS